MSGKLQHLWSFPPWRSVKLTFTLRPLPAHTDWLLSWDTLIMVNCWELQLLPQFRTPTLQKRLNLPEVSLGTHGLPCHLHHLLPWPACWEWVFLHSSLWITLYHHFSPPLSGASSSKSLHPLFNVTCCSRGPGLPSSFCVQCPGPLSLSSLFHNSIHNSLATFLYSYLQSPLPAPFCLAQLTGPVKLNLTSLAFPKGSPSLSDHVIQRIRLPSLETRTTASIILSSRLILEHVSN